MSKQVYQNILQQLGGQRFVAMTGAKNFIALENGIQFDLPKYAGVKTNRVCIFLNNNDLYDIEFGRIFKKKDPEYGVMMPMYEVIAKALDIYAENLRSSFTTFTGLDTSL